MSLTLPLHKAGVMWGRIYDPASLNTQHHGSFGTEVAHAKGEKDFTFLSVPAKKQVNKEFSNALLAMRKHKLAHREFCGHKNHVFRPGRVRGSARNVLLPSLITSPKALSTLYVVPHQ